MIKRLPDPNLVLVTQTMREQSGVFARIMADYWRTKKIEIKISTPINGCDNVFGPSGPYTCDTLYVPTSTDCTLILEPDHRHSRQECRPLRCADERREREVALAIIPKGSQAAPHWSFDRVGSAVRGENMNRRVGYKFMQFRFFGSLFSLPSTPHYRQESLLTSFLSAGLEGSIPPPTEAEY
jgi:hypothetical protein